MSVTENPISFALISTVLTSAVLWLVWRWFGTPVTSNEGKHYCVRCGTIAPRFYYNSGSALICLFLLLLLVVPAILYRSFHRSREYWGCPRCKSKDVIPVDLMVA
jgi:hypothetical protein